MAYHRPQGSRVRAEVRRFHGRRCRGRRREFGDGGTTSRSRGVRNRSRRRGDRADAHRHGVKVIEDAAHALPARCDDRLIGSWESDACVFSFYASKPITTGEGGMIVTRNPKIAARSRVMRTHGLDRDAFDRFREVGASWAYDVVAPGFKYNLTDVAAAIG